MVLTLHQERGQLLAQNARSPVLGAVRAWLCTVVTAAVRDRRAHGQRSAGFAFLRRRSRATGALSSATGLARQLARSGDDTSTAWRV
jgi:hypothetical protein